MEMVSSESTIVRGQECIVYRKYQIYFERMSGLRKVVLDAVNITNCSNRVYGVLKLLEGSSYPW